MKTAVRHLRVGFTLLLLGLGLPAWAATVLYPDAQSPEFSVVVPDDWQVEPAEESGGFVSFTSPAGGRLSLRTVAATRAALEDAMAQTAEWMNETYGTLRLSKPLEPGPGTFAGHRAEGTGMRRSDGRTILIALDWFLFQPDQHMEAWLEIEEQDETTLNGAASIIASLSAR